MPVTMAIAVLAVGAEKLEGRPLRLIVLMPCRNEAETAETCVRKTRELLECAAVCGEVLVVTTMRVAIASVTLILVGAEILFASFLFCSD